MESVRLRGAAEREGHFVFGVVRSMVKLGWRAEGGREGTALQSEVDGLPHLAVTQTSQTEEQVRAVLPFFELSVDRYTTRLRYVVDLKLQEQKKRMGTTSEVPKIYI